VLLLPLVFFLGSSGLGSLAGAGAIGCGAAFFFLSFFSFAGVGAGTSALEAGGRTCALGAGITGKGTTVWFVAGAMEIGIVLAALLEAPLTWGVGAVFWRLLGRGVLVLATGGVGTLIGVKGTDFGFVRSLIFVQGCVSHAGCAFVDLLFDEILLEGVAVGGFPSLWVRLACYHGTHDWEIELLTSLSSSGISFHRLVISRLTALG
jgi:hypothetical protein